VRYPISLAALCLFVLVGCQVPTAPVTPSVPSARPLLDEPVRPPCDTTGGNTCHGTMPWY
jgi:hypothetical protein